MPYCIIFPRLPTSACASRHAPCVPCWIAFIIIRRRWTPSSVVPVNNHFIYIGMTTAAWQSSFWQMGQIGGPSKWLHWAARLWCISNPCGRAWHFLFSRGDTCILPKWVTYAFLTMPSLISSWYLCSTLWTDGLKPLWFRTKFVLDMHVCFYSIEIWQNREPFCWRPWLAGVRSIS
jgi:hypothetical protein